jgi:hypothetical protein
VSSDLLPPQYATLMLLSVTDDRGEAGRREDQYSQTRKRLPVFVSVRFHLS